MEENTSVNVSEESNSVEQPLNDDSLAKLQEFLMNRGYGKSIGFTKPTLEKRVEIRRQKEKRRRKLNLIRRRAAR